MFDRHANLCRLGSRRSSLRRGGRCVARLPCLPVLLCIGALACEDFGPRVYTAQRFQPDPGCLDGYTAIGLVQAQDVGAECEAVCLRLGDDLYVSTVCPPYPAEVSLETADSADCGGALSALAAEASCEDAGDAGDL